MAFVRTSQIVANYFSPLNEALGKLMERVKLGTLMYLMKEVDELYESILPEDYIETEAHEVEADLQEDFERVNVLVKRLKVALQENEQEKARLILVEVVALVTGIEGLIGNIARDARDVLTGVYRLA